MWVEVQKHGGRGDWRRGVGKGKEKKKKKSRGHNEGVKEEYWYFLDNFRRIGEGSVTDTDFLRVRGKTR